MDATTSLRLRLVLSTAVLSLSGCSESPRNVILVTVDTLRADRIGAYGYEAARTPTLDSLAECGTVFLQATTPFPRTTPAMASLFTGLRPEGHGSREVFRKRKTGTLLAQILRETGYDTIGVCSNRSAGSSVGLAGGFRVFDETSADKAGNFVTHRALVHVRRVDSTRPLFLWVHYVDPHWPYSPPATFPIDRDIRPCGRLQQYKRGLVFGNHAGRSERVVDACSAAYDAEVSFVDSQIGTLLERLEASGHLDERSLVIVTSDHGENLGEDELYFEHGPSTDDASVRVPLIMVGPGIPRGAVDRGVARLEDVLPTVLNLLGVPEALRPAVHGIDLSPRLGGRPAGAGQVVALIESGSSLRTLDFARIASGKAHGLNCTNGRRFSLCGRPGEVPRLYDHDRDPELRTDLSEVHPEVYERLLAARQRWAAERARERAIRTDRFKLVQRPRLGGGYSYSLYDLTIEARPGRDVSGDFPETAVDLRSRLDSWAALLDAGAPDERTAEELEALRALGYVGP